ncbi:hypothetical protein EZS27_024996 [termite gut metagenome]|uniref:Uncharacterized protein n=1 Tax=termite gut metagenome TaxID=433724 RepID=A0A5J4QZF1_9ZZZZ
MENSIRNTQFDNLVNYETGFLSNSSRQIVDYQTSADPNALSALSKNQQIIEYTIAITQENTVLHVEQ